MTRITPYTRYLRILDSAEAEALNGNFKASRQKIERYKRVKQYNDDSLEREVRAYEENDRSVTGFLFDKRCLSIFQLEELEKRVERVNKLVNNGSN